MRALACNWRVEEVFDRILFARLASPRPVERDYVKNNISELVKERRAPSELSADLRRIIGDGPSQQLSLRRRPLSRLHREVFLLAKLASALDRGDKRNIYTSIIDVFRFDRGLIKFLDWARITREVRRSLDVTVESAFVTMLLNEPDVRTHHPRAAMSMGKGALIGDLTALLRAGGGQNTGFAKIFAQVRTLPSSAAQAMTMAILSRDIVERLAAALSSRPDKRLSFLPSGDSTYISFLRVSAIKAAASRTLIPAEIAETEIVSEIQQLRYNYFQNRMRIGRVRVPWDDIALATKKVLDEFAPSGLLKALAAREAPDDVLRRLVQFITEKLATHILYDGPVSIDHALSDNLRHGIVVPRFLKTFDDALQTTSQRHGLAGWEVDELTGIFGTNSEAVLQYRDSVAEIIKGFVDTDLVVVVDGPLHRAVFDGIAEILEQYFRSHGKRLSAKPETKVARLAQRLVRRALKSASRRLSDHIRRAVIQELNNVRSRCRHSGNGKTKEFLDCLETNLYEAIDEVRQWIGIADTGGDVIPFTLQEVVDLELLTTQFNALKRLKVKVEHEVFRADETAVTNYSIQGRFLAAFESIVHNLMSNAFKYSGAGLQTDIRLFLRLTPDRFFLRSENKVTADKIEEVIANFQRTVALARKTIGPEVRQDKQSGFQKIRSAISREFNAEPSINIPPHPSAAALSWSRSA